MMSWSAAVVIIVLLLDFAQPRQSDDVVFHVPSAERSSAIELAKEHGLEYVSELFPGSDYHHAIKKPLDPVPFSLEKLSADPRVYNCQFLCFCFELN